MGPDRGGNFHILFPDFHLLERGAGGGFQHGRKQKIQVDGARQLLPVFPVAGSDVIKARTAQGQIAGDQDGMKEDGGCGEGNPQKGEQIPSGKPGSDSRPTASHTPVIYLSRPVKDKQLKGFPHHPERGKHNPKEDSL